MVTQQSVCERAGGAGKLKTSKGEKTKELNKIGENGKRDKGQLGGGMGIIIITIAIIIINICVCLRSARLCSKCFACILFKKCVQQLYGVAIFIILIFYRRRGQA